MKKFLLFFFLIFSVGLLDASAQSRTLAGKVIAKDGKKPVAGATVIVVGTNNGGITDNNGAFEIYNVNGAVKLDVSFIGFETAIIDVPATKTNVVIELEASALAMEDVIVTGYGNYSKKSFTGAASNIDMGEVADMPAVSVESKLAGSVPGVTVSSNQGGPGSVSSIKIRGRGSINASTSPLYVIDGVPMASGDGGSFDVGGGGSSLLATLNPNDIASMTVIKDAAAASLYGSRAANGVIVITTKQGKVGKAKINLKADWGFSDMAIDYRPQLSGPQRASLLYTGRYNQIMDKSTGTPEKATASAEKLVKDYASEPWSGWTDWKDVLFRKGFYQNYEASISGGSENTRYYSSVSYTDQQGITPQQGYERYTGRINVNTKQGRFTFSANAMFSVSDQGLASTDTGIFGYGSPIVCAAWYCSPSQYPYMNPNDTSDNDLPESLKNHPDDNGDIDTAPYYSGWFPAGGGVNPVSQREYNEFHTGFNRTMVSGTAGFNILKGFDVKEVFSYDVSNERSYVWYDPRSSAGKSDNGSMQYYSTQMVKLNSQTHLTFKRTFADKHNLDLLAGYEIEDNPLSKIYSTGKDYAAYQLREIKNAANNEGSWSTKNNNRLVSYVGKADYNYDGRYYFGASYRMDGSSRFAPDTRWGSFWSVSGSWVISNEKFVEPIADILTLAKVRASYGVNGTQPNNYYGYMGLYSYGYKYAGYSGMDLSQVLNEDLTWEKNYATNIGFDVSLWNRLNISMDLYNRDTKDLLMYKDVSNTSGFSSALQNVGEMNNKGIEFSINGDVLRSDEFSWNLGLNLAHNKNTLEKLDGVQTEMINYSRIFRVGENYYSFYLKEFAGINSETGESQFYSNKKLDDGTLSRELVDYNDAQKILIEDKPADPTLTGAISSQFAWKGIDFGFVFTFQLGAYVNDRINYQYATSGLEEGAIPVYYDVDKMWKNPGDNATLPRFVLGKTSDTDSSVHLMSTDHLRLKNITLGYSFPKAWTNKVGIDRLRVYASGSNLLTFKKKECVVDPEMYGTVSFESPNLRTVTFGLDITF